MLLLLCMAHLSAAAVTTSAPVSDMDAGRDVEVLADEGHTGWRFQGGRFSSWTRQGMKEEGYQLDVMRIGRKDGQAMDLHTTSSVVADGRWEWRGEAVTFQYLQEPDGVRQNFLLAERPTGSGPLRIELGLTTGLRPVPKDGLGIGLLDNAGMEVMAYEGLQVWDAEGRSLNAWMQLEVAPEEGYRVVVSVDDQQAVWPIVVDPISTTPDAFLYSTWGLGTGHFGFAVSSAGDLNGDGFSDVVIGGPLTNFGQVDEGAVFICYGSPTGIPDVPDLNLQLDQAFARFGYSVSTAGDVNGDGYSDIIVGAPFWESTGSESAEGGAFVYFGGPGGISTTPDQTLQINLAGAQFGWSVSTAGDINNDGYSDVVVGAWQADYPLNEEGAAFVYMGGPAGLNTNWAHRLEANQALAHFGISVACAGDVNGDGYSDIIVGADQFDALGSNDGVAYLYHGGPGGLTGVLPAPNMVLTGSGLNTANFGYAVNTAGDVNGDGYSDVVVGAYRDELTQTDEGRAYVFHGSPAGVANVPNTVLQSNQASAWFGRAVGTAGDMNGDGYADLVVGAPRWTTPFTLEGASFLYLGGPSGISAPQFIRHQRYVVGANFGEGAATAGDVNGDGYSDLIIGARIYSGNGSVSVYHGGGYPVNAVPDVAADGDQAGGRRGERVAPGGDINGDGFADLLVGAPDEGPGGAGRMHVHYGSATGLSSIPDLTITGNAVSASPGFASDLCTAGDVNGDGYADVIVGAPDSGPGRALLFLGGPGGLSPTPAVTLTSALPRFGLSVATAGDVNSDGYADIVVGSDGGGAIVHVGSPGGLVATPHATLGGVQAGRDVSTAGDVNGDGYSDVIVAQGAGANAALVYLGGQLGLSTIAGASIPVQNAVGGGNPVSAFTVASAGDMNGDGRDDVLVGSPFWENNASTPDEGAVFLYFGNPGGIQLTPFRTTQANIANAQLGSSIASAGDINGDGYADYMAGAPTWTSGQTGEGSVTLWQGARNGVPQPAATQQSNLTDARFGTSVAGLGDTNGDGYSDIAVGAPQVDLGLGSEGRVFLSYGNRSGNQYRICRQYLADLVSPLSTNGMDFSDPDHFGIGHFSRHPVHRSQGRLIWEVVFEGQPFSGLPISNSVLVPATGPWTDLGTAGTELKQLIYKTPNFIRYKWRVRVEYPLAKAIDGQRFSRWYYGYANGHGDVGVLPIELVDLQAWEEGGGNRVEWVTATEENSSHFDVERSTDGSVFEPIGAVPASGNSLATIRYVHYDQAPPPVAYYRLSMVDLDGTWEHSPIVSVVRRLEDDLTAYPVPAIDRVHVTLPQLPEGGSAALYDALGQLVRSWPLAAAPRQGSTTVDIGDLPAGNYLVRVSTSRGTDLGRARIVKQ